MSNAVKVSRFQLLLIIGFTSFLPTVNGADDEIDLPMYRIPEIVAPRIVKTFPEALPRLWLEALRKPEADYKSKAALAIAKAHEMGMKGLKETAPALMSEVERPNADPIAVRSIARALAALDAREAAPRLLQLATSGDLELLEIVDPALARWDFRPARDAWLNRLKLTEARRGVVLAIQSLVTVKESRAIPPLRDLVFSPSAATPVRLEAARALGALRTNGGEEDAKRLAADTLPRGLIDRVAAAQLLRQHSGSQAGKQLSALAVDSEPSVAAIALNRLNELDPALVEPLLDKLVSNPDASIRGQAVAAMAKRPSEMNFRRLADRLSDPHPDIRRRARQSLRNLAKHESDRKAIVDLSMSVLAGADWRGQEQAAMLLALLRYAPAKTRILALLSASRPEVCVAAAWSLRTLAEPDTLPAALEHFQKVLAGQSIIPPAIIGAQSTQLALFFGQAKFKPAHADLARLIAPRSPPGTDTRAAAIWALAHIHEGRPAPDLVAPLADRVSAVRVGDVEDDRVRRMSAIALGMMKAEGGLGTLRTFYRSKKPSLDPVNNACGWAIEKITGERVPDPGIVEVPQRDWFVTPLN